MRITCPPSIKTSQRLAADEKGWQQHEIGTENRALYADLYRGPLENLDIITPSSSKDVGDVRRTTWAIPEAARADGIFLVCSYQNTRVVLSALVPASAKACVMDISKDRRLAVPFRTAYCE